MIFTPEDRCVMKDAAQVIGNMAEALLMEWDYEDYHIKTYGREAWDGYMAWAEEQENLCHVGISTGGFDPYGTSCDLQSGHEGPHEGPDWFGCGRMKWTGGGSCVGDPLPFTILEHFDD